MSLRRAIPSLVTLAALTLGVMAIRSALLGDHAAAAWLILDAMLLDQVDGVLARLLRARTRIGAELDSFSDFVAFGLAPAFLVLGVPSPDGALLITERALALVYIYGCALRLARYNTRDAPDGAEVFRGVPSTLAGALVATAVLTAMRHGAPWQGLPLAALLAMLGVLMVSDPLRPPKIHVLAARAAARGPLAAALVVATVVTVYATVLARVLPEYVAGLALLYGGVGSVLGRRPVAAAALTKPGAAGSSG